MPSSLGFERTSYRPRDGHHRSVNREARKELNDRRRKDHDIQIAIGRWVLPRTHSKKVRNFHHPVAEFASRLGQGNNQEYGQSVLSNFLILEYVTPNMMANIYDTSQKETKSKKSQKMITPRGRKENFRAVKKDIQESLSNAHKESDPRDLEMQATIRRRIFEDKFTGTIELAVHKSPEVEQIVVKDLVLINTVLQKHLPGTHELDIQDVALRIPIFSIDEKYRNADIELEWPFITMAPVTFQPLGIHEIPSS